VNASRPTDRTGRTGCRGRRWLAGPVLGAALAVGAASCGSSPAGGGASPAPAGSSSQTAQRQADAPALIVDCVVVRGLTSTVLSSVGRASWVTSLGVQLTPSNRAAFGSWYQAHRSDTVAGQTLAHWQQSAVQSGQLPSAVCGANGLNGMSASQLQKQVFAKDPAAGNPWG
jgi:hypothetical protein